MRRKPKYLDRERREARRQRSEWVRLSLIREEAMQRVNELLRQSATVKLISPLHCPPGESTINEQIKRTKKAREVWDAYVRRTTSPNENS